MFVRKFPRHVLTTLLAAALKLAACNVGAAPSPTLDTNAINTAIVGTTVAQLSAQFTQTALPAPQATNTSPQRLRPKHCPLLPCPQPIRPPVSLKPGHFARQAFFITLMNLKAIVFYMAFFPLFIDAGQHRGFVTFAAMAATIAVVTLAYCRTLCVFADAVSERVRAHRQLSLLLQRPAGIALIGFGLKLAR